MPQRGYPSGLRGLVGWIATASVIVLTVPFGAAADTDPPTRCVRYWPEARYVIGYDQLVHVQNTCDRAARCEVSSDRNPKVQVVDLAPGDHRVVTTDLGAASAGFTPIVNCTLAGT